MRTTVSLPDELFQAADALASQLGVSRSELYAIAVAEYLAKHRASDVAARLDAIYATESSALDPVLQRAQSRTIQSDEW